MAIVVLPSFCPSCKQEYGSLSFYKKVDDIFLYACNDCIKNGISEDGLIRMAYIQGFHDTRSEYNAAIGNIRNPLHPNEGNFTIE